MFNSNNKQIATSILSLGKFYRIVYTVNSMTAGGECSSVDHSSLLIPSDVEPSNADVRYWGDALRRAEVTAESVGDFMASHCGFVLNAKAEYSIHDVLCQMASSNLKQAQAALHSHSTTDAESRIVFDTTLLRRQLPTS